MVIKKNITLVGNQLSATSCKLVAVSKRQDIAKIREAYDAGHRIFGENVVQELVQKKPLMPADVQWHMIGHMQRNKVKYISSFIDLIHSVDSWALLQEIHKQGVKAGRVISCLLQVRIASEETKFGMSDETLLHIVKGKEIEALSAVKVVGLMGMATNTTNEAVIRSEFKKLRMLFDSLKDHTAQNVEMRELSMGMSADYLVAVQEGSTLVRVGSAIFGERRT